MTQKIVDCHVHLNKYRSLKNLSLKERIDVLSSTMESNDVDTAIVLSSYKISNERPSANEIITLSEKYESIKVVAGYSISNHSDNHIKEYNEYLKNDKIKGLKIYPGYEHYYPYDPKYQKIIDLGVEYDVPLMIHTGDTYTHKGKLRYSHPLNVDDVAVDNPEL